MKLKEELQSNKQSNYCIEYSSPSCFVQPVLGTIYCLLLYGAALTFNVSISSRSRCRVKALVYELSLRTRLLLNAEEENWTHIGLSEQTPADLELGKHLCINIFQYLGYPVIQLNGRQQGGNGDTNGSH